MADLLADSPADFGLSTGGFLADSAADFSFEWWILQRIFIMEFTT